MKNVQVGSRSEEWESGTREGPQRTKRCVNSQFAWSETEHDVRDDLFSNRTATGGIAQLVERQLCKLDVRGSSPRASTSFGKKERQRKELLINY